ncbi:MAG: ABC transporter ATP-binding protein [Geminicoccaceae bacterium]
MAAVTLENVVKRYGAVEVVHGIDLEIGSKEFVVLVGPSGCGKSTTLRMVAGLEEVSEGTISIGGKVVNEVAPKDRDVAMVFQNYALYPHLNVAENIAFGLRIRRVKKQQIAQSVAEVAEILGLTEYLERRPAELSGGQRQRVAMGRAIVRHPEVFLFDEPLSNLDATLRTQMRAEIKRLHKRLGVTSVYVTHDQVEAMTLADRIVIMNEGRIEQIGTPMDLFMNPVNTFIAGFIGSPPMNLIDAEVVSEGDALKAQVGDDASFPLPPAIGLANGAGRAITIGIRPEDAGIEQDGRSGGTPCILDLVEPLGSEALVHTSVAGHPFIVKAETRGDFDHLAMIDRLYFDPAHVHVFDRETGNAISALSAGHGK